jgi:hypothetical protein
MSLSNSRTSQQLHAFASPTDVAKAPARERRFTKASTTLSIALRACIAIAVTACGHHHASNASYAQATNDEQTCCEHLSGSGRDSCLSSIVRVKEPGDATVEANERTYACMAEHFSCDATTGHATKTSAQAQLDCIEDLHQ